MRIRLPLARTSSRLPIALAGCLILAGQFRPAVAATEPSNVWARARSVSRQFLGFAPTPLLAHALCVFGDRVKQQWQAQTGASAAWRDPIVLVIRAGDPAATNAPGVTLSIQPGDRRIRYEITCRTPPSPEVDTLVARVVEALCAETANRSRRPRPGQLFEPVVVPWWLTAGLAQSIRGRDEELVEQVRRALAGGRSLTVDQLLALTRAPSDLDEERRYRAYCWLFVEALQSQEDGSRCLARLVASWGGFRDARAALAAVYGSGFAEPQVLERWWGVQLAGRTATVLAQNLPLPVALEKLGEVLPTRLTYTDAGATGETVVAFAQLGRHADAPWFGVTVRQKRQALYALHRHAAPNVRPVITDYLEALGWLETGRIVRFERAARRADAGHHRLRELGDRLTEYLDQAERVYGTGNLDGLFRDYFQTLEQVEQVRQQRRSPISDYLDQFDR
ncbi:hypothetical protein HQ590_06010 [bacterium]|nr:hypothetical protein [bacterium]